MPGAVKGSRQHRMTVVPHRPWQRAALWIVGALFLALLLVATYRAGFERGADHLAMLDVEHSRDLPEAQPSERRVDELQAALSVAERNRQVDEQVNAQAQTSIALLRSRISLLERDVALYRQVMALEPEAPALSMQAWQLFRTELADQYRYRIILAYSGADGAVLTGQLRIAVDGVMMPADLQGPDQYPGRTIVVSEPVNLRYLQVLEGYLPIPSGFTANHVKLDFNADSSSTLVFSESMPWQPEGEF